MIQIQFTLPIKYDQRNKEVVQLINRFQGDYRPIQTKDGIFYRVNFQNLRLKEQFNKSLESLIPDIHEY